MLLSTNSSANAQEYHEKACGARLITKLGCAAKTKLEPTKAISGLWVLTILAKLGEEVA